eukprot:GHVU01081799.1.p1 GENE.GHVU01081799.1~~GHVU01081799.1.p1  ORF type:complete len:708 (+),score=189.62 GHVU01081799.1:223-2346(+)
MEKEQQLLTMLEELQISHERFSHPPLPDMAAMMKHLGHVEGAKLKNMFLADKNKKKYFLLVALNETQVSMKALAAALKISNPRLCSEEALMEKLGVAPGAVNAFSVVNDTDNKVAVLLDKAIEGHEYVLAHPQHNEATFKVKTSDLLKFLQTHNHPPTWLDLTAAPAETPLAIAATTTASGSDGRSTPTAKASPTQQQPTGADKDVGTALIGITADKDANFPEWYSQAITKAEMIEYYDISGCYIFRPASYFIWEQIRDWFDAEIKKLGVKNAYFPLFVSKANLETEKAHVEGFSPEVAWVTKSGDSDLDQPIAIRPTSETIMYPAFHKWIRSHRDLPLKLNQWTSVVRWEFSQPTPFIRTREFLWNEGHTAHATDDEATEMTLTIIDLYRRVYEDLLAVPVIPGTKSEKEKFAGGKMTTTVEAFVPNTGRGVQAATSHHLGDNFSKMFKIEYEDEHLQRQRVHQTSWAITTRSIGVMVMVHGDNKGVVVPPRVAEHQAVLLPIFYSDGDLAGVQTRCREIATDLRAAGIRVTVDDRINYTPGYKFNHWELMGTPLRLEVGPKDMEKQQVKCVRRDTGTKSFLSWEGLGAAVQRELDAMHDNLLAQARKKFEDAIVKVSSWEEVLPVLAAKKVVMAPWCETPESEEWLKTETQRLLLAAAQDGQAPALGGSAKSLCMPFKQDPMPEGTVCFITGKPATRWCLFGRSY